MLAEVPASRADREAQVASGSVKPKLDLPRAPFETLHLPGLAEGSSRHRRWHRHACGTEPARRSEGAIIE
eukprot:9280342-Pyramimonas_sp.AAC.1